MKAMNAQKTKCVILATIQRETVEAAHLTVKSKIAWETLVTVSLQLMTV